MDLDERGNSRKPDDFPSPAPAPAAGAPSRAAGAPKLGFAPSVADTATVRASTLGRFTEVGERTAFVESTLGHYSYIVNDGDVMYTDIGNLCSIAAQVRLNPSNHPIWRATTSHLVYRAANYWPDAHDEPELFAWRRAHRVTIGHDVWIGHGAVVMPGVSVGTGAVIASGAVVTKDVGAYEIVGGVPAALIRRRFNAQTAARLQRIALWDWDHDRLGAALTDLRTLSIEAFCDRYDPGD